MNASSIFALLGSTVVLAGVAVVVTNGGQSAQVFKSLGDSWSGILRAATGK